MKRISRPLTVDIICERKNKILLIKRDHDPFKDYWALPGGFVDEETVEEAAVRELKEETSLIVRVEDLNLLNIYSEYDRDPRHAVSIVYWTDVFKGVAKSGDDAKEVKWIDIYKKIDLAFDHNQMLNDFLKANLTYDDLEV